MKSIFTDEEREAMTEVILTANSDCSCQDQVEDEDRGALNALSDDALIHLYEMATEEPASNSRRNHELHQFDHDGEVDPRLEEDPMPDLAKENRYDKRSTYSKDNQRTNDMFGSNQEHLIAPTVNWAEVANLPKGKIETSNRTSTPGRAHPTAPHLLGLRPENMRPVGNQEAPFDDLIPTQHQEHHDERIADAQRRHFNRQRN